MQTLARTLGVLALLAIPVLVVLNVPRLLELSSAVQTPSTIAALPTPFRLEEPTAAPRSRIAGRDESPPPTLAPPSTTERPTAPSVPTPTGERVVIANTGGIGAVLRAEPVSGPQVAALREQLVLVVLERRTVSGSGEWLRVQTPDGKEGWVTARVAQPAPSPRP
jgi:hypothetical protein